MPHYAPNKAPAATKKRYFELIRQGHKGAKAARMVGVSTSCGSLWFLDAGGVLVPDPGPISPRFLTQDDRIAIADGVRSGASAKAIAAVVGKSFQTVYRELERNSKPDGSYQPWWAHNQALRRRQRPKPSKISANKKLRAVVSARLAVRWSPQQISRFLHRTYPARAEMQVCAETIYLAVFAGALGEKKGKVRTGRTYRKHHRRGVAVPNKIKNMRLLDQRPAAVALRLEHGHWEGDLIIGRMSGSAIATLVERVTRFVMLVHLPDGYKAPQLYDALTEQLTKLPPALRRSLTWDQGREMSMHEHTAQAAGIDVYFCDPHSPWQRGSNENMNGLLRQYFPKHTDLSVYMPSNLRSVAAELNDRPRLILGDRTPSEAVRDFLKTAPAA
jgi:IS30 family transposase